VKGAIIMTRFEPDLVFFEPKALEYPVGDALYKRFKDNGMEIKITPSHNRVTGIPGDTPAQAYGNAKRTLVVGVKKTMKLDTSKPSADFALPDDATALEMHMRGLIEEHFPEAKIEYFT
jgi:spore photoproduct lyase